MCADCTCCNQDYPSRVEIDGDIIQMTYYERDRATVAPGYRQGSVVTFPVECYETCYESGNEAKEKGLRLSVTHCFLW